MVVVVIPVSKRRNVLIVNIAKAKNFRISFTFGEVNFLLNSDLLGLSGLVCTEEEAKINLSYKTDDFEELTMEYVWINPNHCPPTWNFAREDLGWKLYYGCDCLKNAIAANCTGCGMRYCYECSENCIGVVK
ncbi:MAG: hypothetical protein HeimC2_21770 [Candidatus Heimdallarchaeota archaeon LC_2]|nr:MAG: hypothetical protein HeimC2_21770 [Candidatus Heimdallarchaeota archaeon LC_2]